MSDGPRDWSPPGYWGDSTAAVSSPRRARRTDSARTLALASVMFGLFAVGWPLALSSPHPGAVGWAVTTAGLTAVFLASRSKQAGGGGFLPTIGVFLGVIGTVLCVWTLLAFYFPSAVPAAPAVQASPLAPGGRIVEPFDTADVTVPAQQLRANLRHVIFSLAPMLVYEREHGTLPSSLSADPDGTIRSPGATYSKIASYMALTYGVVAGPAGFTLTVTDSVSGMAETVDPVTRDVIDQ